MIASTRRLALATTLAAALAGCATGPALNAPNAPSAPMAALDTTSAAGQLDTFMRMRASNDGKPVFANWWVTVFAVVPGERPREIMKLDGYNIGRFIKAADGSADFVSREVAYYKDSRTGEILKEWTNPFTNERNNVLHVANDPVNGKYAAPKAGEAGRFPFMVSGDDVFLRLDIPLAYPNALLPAEFPAESSGPTYLASEHFTFFAKATDLRNSALPSVPLTYAWARTGPWLPWMKMGTRPGYLIYSGHGRKYASFDELPADVKAFTMANFPQYATAPAAFTAPNETSWTYYKKLFGKKP
jgi:Protein of unknown function (DUF1838)